MNSDAFSALTLLCCLVMLLPFYLLALVWLLRLVQMWWWRGSLCALEIRLPHSATVEQVARWLSALRTALHPHRWWSPIPRWPIGLEVTATRDGITRVLLVPRSLRADVMATLSAVMPGARLTEQTCYRPNAWARVAAEARQKGGDELLDTDRGEDTNRHLLAALQPLETGEAVRVQWLLVAARAAGAYLPDRITPREAGQIGGRWKQLHPMMLGVCRVGVMSPVSRARARSVFERVWSALYALNTPWTQLARTWLRPSFFVALRMRARAVPLRRWPLLLTPAEVSGLLGLVVGAEALPGVPEGISRTLPPATVMPTDGLVVAASNYPGVCQNLCLTPKDRLRHVWGIGPTGAGKSTLLANCVTYDMHRGDGLVLIDPRADLVADVLDRVPADRHDDVIVIDPTASDFVVGFNPLAGGPPEQAAGFVMHVLQSLFASSWGPRTADILRASLLSLTSTRSVTGERFTLVDVAELLTNQGFRRFVTSQGLSAQVMAFWRWYENLSDGARTSAISPALNKLRAFTMSTPLRLMLGQSGGLDMAEAMAQRKIVLVPLHKAALGDENAALVGSLVMSAVWQASLARASIPHAERHPFWLYLDEFQDIVRLPLDLANMLAQARGFSLGLILAHQFLHQLSADIKAAVLHTARTHVVFQLGPDDAKELAPHFAPLNAEDLKHLGPHEIALRPCVNSATLPPVTGKTFPAPEPTCDGRSLAARSRATRGALRADIDAQILARTATRPAPASGEPTERPGRIPLREPQP